MRSVDQNSLKDSHVKKFNIFKKLLSDIMFIFIFISHQVWWSLRNFVFEVFKIGLLKIYRNINFILIIILSYIISKINSRYNCNSVVKFFACLHSADGRKLSQVIIYRPVEFSGFSLILISCLKVWFYSIYLLIVLNSFFFQWGNNIYSSTSIILKSQ